MPRLLRPAALLCLLLGLALTGAACGGDDPGDGASASTDVDQLLQQTFSGSKKVESGVLDLKLKIEASGEGASEMEGPVEVRLAGPFQTEGGGKLPQFKLDASFEGAGQSLSAGATSTGDKGYLSFQGTDYEVDDRLFQQFKAGFEEAQKQGSSGDAQSFASLGMDPRKWLVDPKNEGDAKVGDDDTIKITGGVDVAKLLDDVNNALEKASALGLGNTGQVPEKLTAQQKQEVTAAVKDPRVEIYTGKDDTTLRRMVVDFGLDDKASSTQGDIAFDVSIQDLNEDQSISAPEDAKPFSELASQLQGLGALGALGGGAGASGSGSGGSGSGGTAGGGSTQDLEKFQTCIEKAGNDTAKARDCADLLTG
jgi:hypothetical protein